MQEGKGKRNSNGETRPRIKEERSEEGIRENRNAHGQKYIKDIGVDNKKESGPKSLLLLLFKVQEQREGC